uniref:RAN binding protein 17 n=1 Tax=Meleagris gallopavo TaxID=9103 RepID=G1MSL5_MELGA
LLKFRKSLSRLRTLCLKYQLYEGTDVAQQMQAENMVLELINSPDCLSQCQLLLEQRAVILAATCLSRLVSRASPLPIEQRIDIRNYLLNYVTSQPTLAPLVTQALVQVIAKITKLGWFGILKDQLVFKDVIADVEEFLQNTVERCIIGVMILSELTQPSAKHHEIAASFLGTSLKDILVLACSLLKEVRLFTIKLKFIQHLLKLVLNCLNLDSIGNSADKSADDLHTVQIPGSWRRIFLEPETLDLFFDLYHCLPPMLSQLVIQFASTRGSLFNNPEGARYLGNLIKGAKQTLENPQGLSDPSNNYEFFVADYPEVIQLIANYTITGLQHWEFAPNSVHYLLTLWQRMVASVPFVRTAEPHLLDTYAPEITKAYITSRLECVPVVVRGGLEDPLDDTATVTCTLLGQLFDQNAQNY